MALFLTPILLLVPAGLRAASADAAPVITVQPVGGAVVAGSSVALGVVATATPTPTYQWRKNGQALAGATTASLGFTADQYSAGQYDVVVTNYLGSATSGGVELTVTGLPVVGGVGPVRQVVGVGQDFTVAASVSGGTTYQWLRNGVAITGATGMSHTITAAEVLRDNGRYQLVASNANGSVHGPILMVRVVPAEAEVVVWGEYRPAGLAASSGVVQLARGGYAAQQAGGQVVGEVPGTLPVAVGMAARGGYGVAVQVDGSVVEWSGSGGLPTVRTGVSDAVEVAVGRSHTVALRSDGRVVVWGSSNFNGQLNVPAWLDKVVAVAAGADHSLALRSDGTVVGWGKDWGALSVPAGLGEVVAVATGFYHGLGLRRDGTVVAWGSGFAGQNGVPAGLSGVVAIAAAHYGNMALKQDGTVAAWGAIEAPPALLGKALGIAMGSSATYNFEGGSAHAVALRAVSADAAPVITVQPVAQSIVTPGAGATLSVTATGTPAPTFQWLLNGTPIPGATQASLSLQSSDQRVAGRYAVVVSNRAGSVTSSFAIVEVSQPGNAATHALTAPGYVAGQTVTVTNTLTYAPTATALSWAVLLPANWTFVSAAGSAGDVGPRAGDGNLLEWAWSSVPASPVTFSYTVNVPAGQAGTKELVALVGVRNGASLQFLARPDPLLVEPMPAHSADTNRDFRISLVELTRVIELYNTRHGAMRSGSYALAATVTEDGFVADVLRAVATVVPLGRYHSADTNRDGKFGLFELTRVIELYNTRSGGSRSGQYKPKSGTEDGFEPGP